MRPSEPRATVPRYTAMVGRVSLILLACAASLPVAATGSDDGRMRVPAVVTGPDGDLVRGLRAQDFDVTADGVTQHLESAALTTAPADAPRVFALLLDEFHVDRASSAMVRDALQQFIDSGIRPTDHVIALKPLDPLTTIEPVVARSQIRDAIASFEGRKGDFAPRTLFEKKYMPQAPAAVAAARAQIVTSALRALVARISDMRDLRAAVVLVSDGFGRTRASRESPADLQTVVRPANGAGAPVYVLSPSSTTGEGDGERALEAVRTLAGQTGGELTMGTDSLAAALTRLARDLDTYYVLTYRPSHGDDGKFHALRLAVKRPKATVRARGGYVAPISPQMRAAHAAALGPRPAPRALRRSPLINAWTGFTRNADGSARVMVTWEPRRLGTAGRPLSLRAVVLTASTPEGEVIFHGRVAPVGGANVPEAREYAAFDAPAGRVWLDMNLVDAAGAVLDMDARDLDVPDLQKAGGVMLPPAILRARSAREFRAVSTDRHAPPAASREFRRTDRLLVRVPAYDGSGAAVTAMLLNGWRQPMRPLPAMPESLGDGLIQFDVPLAPLAPGEYVIRITGPAGSEQLIFRVTG